MGEDGATSDLSMEVGRCPSPPGSVLLGEAVNAICCRLTEAFRLSLVVEGRLDGGGLQVLSPKYLSIFSRLIVLEEKVGREEHCHLHWRLRIIKKALHFAKYCQNILPKGDQ